MTMAPNREMKKPAQGFVSLGLVPRDEIQYIHNALLLDRRNQLADFEFTVRCQGGRRCWQIANDNIIFNFLGGKARFEGIYNLGTEFMSNCCGVHINSTFIEITIDDNIATASSPVGTISMTATGLVNIEFRSINQPKTVEAQISRECLRFLAHSCPSFPDKHFDIDESGEKFPTTTVAIGDNKVKYVSKFNRYGYKNLAITAPAITSGHGSITVSSLLLGQSLSAFDSYCRGTNVTISCDPVDGEFLEFTRNSDYVALRRSRFFVNTKLE